MKYVIAIRHWTHQLGCEQAAEVGDVTSAGQTRPAQVKLLKQQSQGNRVFCSWTFAIGSLRQESSEAELSAISPNFPA